MPAALADTMSTDVSSEFLHCAGLSRGGRKETADGGTPLQFGTESVSEISLPYGTFNTMSLDLEGQGAAVAMSDDVVQDGLAGQAGVHGCTEGI